MKALLIVLAVLLGLLLLPVLLLAIPVRIYAAFDGGLTVSLRLFGIRFRVFDFTAEPKKKLTPGCVIRRVLASLLAAVIIAVYLILKRRPTLRCGTSSKS